MSTNVCKKIRKILVLIDNIFRDFFFLNFLNPPLVVSACVHLKRGRLLRNNFGDDLNLYLLSALSKRKIIFYDYSLICKVFHIKRILAIGSILNEWLDDNCVIWGAGSQLDCVCAPHVNPIIKAVRGPLTREWLFKSDIKCPAVYGDPALLLPRIYNPHIASRKSIGIIPHVLDENSEEFSKFIEYHKELNVISLKNYSSWRDVINKLCSCQLIISSSLHGLILSDAYNIPNIWVKIKHSLGGKDYFKYNDYFLSVGRAETQPIDIEKLMYEDNLLKYKVNYHTISINLDKLISVCPFKIKAKI